MVSASVACLAFLVSARLSSYISHLNLSASVRRRPSPAPTQRYARARHSAHRPRRTRRSRRPGTAAGSLAIAQSASVSDGETSQEAGAPRAWVLLLARKVLRRHGRHARSSARRQPPPVSAQQRRWPPPRAATTRPHRQHLPALSGMVLLPRSSVFGSVSASYGQCIHIWVTLNFILGFGSSLETWGTSYGIIES